MKQTKIKILYVSVLCGVCVFIYHPWVSGTRCLFYDRDHNSLYSLWRDFSVVKTNRKCVE